MALLIVNLLTFAAVFLAVFAANAVIVDLHSSERKRVRQRMEEEFRRKQVARVRATPLPKDISQLAAEARAENAEDRSLWDRFSHMVEQSGLDLTAERLVSYMFLAAVVLGLAGGLIFGNLVAGIVAAMLGAATPYLYVQFKRLKRLNKLRSQLPDAFDLMARVLRSGQTVSQAMQAVTDEFAPPISIEFLYCYEQMNLGLSAEAALRDLGRRTGLLEVRIFVLSVVVHRQTGGNLAELLDKLSHVVRERFRIKGMIDSLTAQGRFQALILLSLPPFMFLLLMFLHRDYEETLLEYPLMIATALGMMAMGAAWIRKIVNFDY